MKTITIGTFDSRADAERAINRLVQHLKVPKDEISFIYRNIEGDVKEVSPDDVTPSTTAEGTKRGASVGAALGGIAGIAVTAGVMPFLAPLFVAGPVAAALGLTGAVGTVAAGAATGAAVGAIAGALTNMGMKEESAKRYEDELVAGKVLLAVHSDNHDVIQEAFRESNAREIDTFRLRI